MVTKTSRDSRKALPGRGLPWLTIAGVAVVLVFAAGIFGYAYLRYADKAERQEALTPWTPSETNKDPARKIPGVVIKDYAAGKHVNPAQRVNYETTPAFGGPHDAAWATCDGVVYDSPVRTENLIHSLEHGAVWIAYDPNRIDSAALDILRDKVVEQPHMVMSPHPGLDSSISLQSWGRQLKLDAANDARVDQFIWSTRNNPNTTPEPGASCSALGPGKFDPDAPPPLDSRQPGPDAVPMAAPIGNERPSRGSGTPNAA